MKINILVLVDMRLIGSTGLRVFRKMIEKQFKTACANCFYRFRLFLRLADDNQSQDELKKYVMVWFIVGHNNRWFRSLKKLSLPYWQWFDYYQGLPALFIVPVKRGVMIHFIFDYLILKGSIKTSSFWKKFAILMRGENHNPVKLNRFFKEKGGIIPENYQEYLYEMWKKVASIYSWDVLKLRGTIKIK